MLHFKADKQDKTASFQRQYFKLHQYQHPTPYTTDVNKPVPVV